MVRDVLESAEVRTKINSRHAESMYVGYGYADCGKDPHIVRVAEALNGPDWVEKVRDVFG